MVASRLLLSTVVAYFRSLFMSEELEGYNVILQLGTEGGWSLKTRTKGDDIVLLPRFTGRCWCPIGIQKMTLSAYHNAYAKK